MKSYYLILFLSVFSISVFAEVKFPSIIGDHMVLQQKSNVNLWGTAKKSTLIQIVTSWNKRKYNIQSDENGSWKISVKTPNAGGPYQILFNDGQEKVLDDIMIGEVWFCSGQSNMEITLAGYKNQPILHSDSIISNANNQKFRFFSVKRAVSFNQLEDCEGQWKPSNPENATSCSAVAFQFGKMLQEKLNVPVGVIVSSWAGTPIKGWMGKSADEFYKNTGSKERLTPNTPSALFNGMVAPLTSFKIKGILWYQGESDRFSPKFYADKMVAMVKDWRNEWNQNKIPFYFVQIAPFAYKDKTKNNSAYIREEQSKANKSIPRSEMVVTADVGSMKTIHPPDKTTVAGRLLKYALSDTYGWNLPAENPEFKSMKIKGDKAILKFYNNDGLTVEGNHSNNFEIAGKDHVFHKASAIIVNNKIEVSSEMVSAPEAVRYCFKNYFEGDIYNKSGSPVAPFRTDDLDLSE